VVVEVAAAEAEDGEEHAALALVLDALDELLVAGQADVEVAVGREDDAVDAVLHEVLAGLRVGEGDAGAAVGRAAGLEALQRVADRLLLVAGGRREHEAGRAGVHDDRDAVLGVHVVDQAHEAVLEQRQLVLLGHRARHVDQEHEVARLADAERQHLALQADLHELVAVRPRARRDLGADRERPVVGRLRVVVVEVIDQLLDAHGRGGGSVLSCRYRRTLL
jgi:hypothetical protein